MTVYIGTTVHSAEEVQDMQKFIVSRLEAIAFRLEAASI